MKFGYLSHNNVEGIKPQHLASELEARGFDSIWMPEHSHIPTDRRTPYPAGGELPSSYYRMMDPLISLMSAAAGSDTLELFTGICLIHEHDLLDLACACATLDVLSGGRFHLGIGVGWNEEELANHRPDLSFKLRYSAMRERVAALRVAWSEERASFDGTWDSFSESFVYPKPTRGTIPISLGNAGPVGIKHAADYADEWCPIDASMLNVNGRPDVPGAIELFRRLATEAGRDPDSIPITIHSFKVSESRFEQYAALGVERIVLFPPSMDVVSVDVTLTHLDKLTEVVQQFA
ncbi:MAG: TIGR03619 family F420-dependent LLM class oxidoreductase [Actinomycetota bacterium]|nr:TIGR03619 family F420-dependent LLM class oxidoreductase [Actinomycetota bacterium]